MMSNITEWRYHVVLATNNEDLGNQLYLLLRAFQNDPVPSESIFTEDIGEGWKGVGLLGKHSLHDAIAEYNSGGYPQLLIDAGKTNAEIDAMRSIVKIDSYDLYATGQRVVNRSFFSDFVASLNL